MNGPWIHQNILETIQNIKSKKIITGGTKVNESDGYCAALPYFLFNDREKELKKVVKSVANSRINEKYALSALHYKDQKSGDEFKVNFKSRQRHDDYINIKKLWKMLEF